MTHRSARRPWATLFAAAPLVLAAALSADAMEGRYKLTDTAQCTPENSEGILRIEDGILYGAESRCRMTNPLEVRDMDATLYDMVCIGEGTGWEERAMMMRGASGGLILLWDGYAFEYEACPTAATRPQARSAETGATTGSDALTMQRMPPPPPRPSTLSE